MPTKAATKEAKIIAVVNNKGGVAKTTSVLNIGAGLARRGKRVLLIDADGQANLTTCFGFPKDGKKSLYEVLCETKSIKDVMIKCTNGVSLVPGAESLNTVEAQAAAANWDMREFRLKHALEEIKDQYDYIFIDCPPAMDTRVTNALAVATEVYIPVIAEPLSLQGLDSIINRIDQIISKRVNSRLRITGVIITLFKPKVAIAKDCVMYLEEKFPNVVFHTRIRDTVTLKEATASDKDIFQYAPNKQGAWDYSALVDEILKREKIENEKESTHNG
ncbi:MAG: ParA family protein [Ignavibacteria bacterium]|nr:ParA family protein [Ignavibacteria bacterium]